MLVQVNDYSYNPGRILVCCKRSCHLTAEKAGISTSPQPVVPARQLDHDVSLVMYSLANRSDLTTESDIAT